MQPPRLKSGQCLPRRAGLQPTPLNDFGQQRLRLLGYLPPQPMGEGKGEALFTAAVGGGCKYAVQRG
jgi:hypothetical protein